MSDEAGVSNPQEEAVDVNEEARPQETLPSLWTQLRRAPGVQACGKRSLVYGVFLALLTAVGVTRIPADQARLVANLRHELVDLGRFEDVASAADFFRYAEGPLVGALLGSGRIAFNSVFLGRARLRQLKVRNDSCVTQYEEESRPGRECRDFFSVFAEDTSTFGTWVHTAPTGPDHSGTYGTYHAGGFVVDLPHDENATVEVVRDLRDGGWISSGTRAVFVELTVYNANVNLLCVVTLLVEFPPQGGTFPSWKFGTMRLPKYRTGTEVLLLICEAAVLLLSIIMLLLEIFNVAQRCPNYPWCSWMTARLVVFILTFVWAGLNVHVYHESLATLRASSASFPDYAWLEAAHRRFVDLEGFLLAAAWLTSIAYLRISTSARRVGRTLFDCWPELALSFGVLAIVFLAHVAFAIHVFGPQAPRFSGFIPAAFSLLQIASVDFEELQAASWFLGPVFYLSYVFFVFFIISSLAGAVLLKAYSQAPVEDAPSVFGVLKNSLRPTEKGPCLRHELLKRGLTDKDVAMLWAELGVDPGQATGLAEALSSARLRLGDSPGSSFVSRHEATSVEGRVTAMAGSLQAARERLVAALDNVRPVVV